MDKPPEFKPALFFKKGSELSLSGTALLEILQAVFAKEKPFRFRAKGFSMSPFIKDGDVVTITPLLGSSPNLGDTVAYLHPKTEKLVIHRVVKKKGASYLIRGDNTLEEDGLVQLANILGRVKRIERDGKEIFLSLGPERFLIAFLTKRGFLLPSLRFVRRLVIRLSRN